MTQIDLKNVDTYLNSSLKVLKENLKTFFGDIENLTIKEIKDKLHDINAYKNLEHLKPLSNEELIILDEDDIDIEPAKEMIANGEFFWEHAAAGEATRLGLGPKYLIDLSKYTIDEIYNLILEEAKSGLNETEFKKFKNENSVDYLRKKLECAPKDLLPISLGKRHMIQMIYDLRKFANEKKIDAKKLIEKQQMLIVINEESGQSIIDEFIRYKFFSLNPKNVFFMIQKSFHGIILKDGALIYDISSKKRLHNHGQMFMQKLHDDSIFFIDNKNRKFLKSKDYLQMLKKHKLMLSYNIEDIEYLTASIDWTSLSLALKLADDGYEMIMEIVKQNPLKPQKGGAAFFDPKIGRICMIESNQLKGIKNEDIEHLNKNFNIYPNPSIILQRLKNVGLPLSFDIKATGEDEHIYFCPVQGDINFLAKTAFVVRKTPKPIQNLKSPATIPVTINAMHKQDMQTGFKELVFELIGN